MSKQLDKKSELTFKTIANLKGANTNFNELAKSIQNYQKAALKLAESGRSLADSLNKVAQMQVGDVGEGINKLAETLRLVENRREVLANAMANDLAATIQKSIRPDENEVIQFENEVKKSRANMASQLKKLEDATKKAGKKGPQALQQSIAELNNKIKEGESLKAEKLRTALLLERKKFCNLLNQWKPIINILVELHTHDGGKFQQQATYWDGLGNSYTQLPPDLEELITSTNQERTLISIANDGGSSSSSSFAESYSSGYDDYGGDSSWGGSGSSSSLGGGGGGGGGYTVTALYDYKGQQPEDLSFFAGEVITVVSDDDGSGWMEGELRGKRGIFPSSYIQYN